MDRRWSSRYFVNMHKERHNRQGNKILTLTYFSTIIEKITSHYMAAEISTNIAEFSLLKTSTDNSAAKSGTCLFSLEMNVIEMSIL